MPLILNSSYLPVSSFYQNPDLNTLSAALLRKVKTTIVERERLDLPDGDFLDLDWIQKSSSTKLALTIHGLEGNARRAYMTGMMKKFSAEGWDAAGINMRGCSGEDNRFLNGYHSGKSEDLDFVVRYCLSKYPHYQTLIIVGFSIGGNIALKYAGEQGPAIPEQVKSVITFSVPCDLAGCSYVLETKRNRFYQWQFLVTLKRKAKDKIKQYPDSFNIEKVLKAKFFRGFDDHFTAPINGYKDAWDYWTQVSCLNYLEAIKIPTLLVNAKDDSFMNEDCYPKEIAANKDNFYLEIPNHGGHLGFMGANKQGFVWTEERAFDFTRSLGL